MRKPLPLSGALADWDLPAILFQMHEQEMNGRLALQGGSAAVEILVEDRRAVHVRPAAGFPPLPALLEQERKISPAEARRLEAYAAENRLSAERAALELGLLEVEALWSLLQRRQLQAAAPCFCLAEGRFEIGGAEAPVPEEPAVPLDMPLLPFVLQGIRGIEDEAFIASRFREDEDFRVTGRRPDLPLASHETHLLRQCGRWPRLGEILRRSPLPRLATLRLLYFFLRCGFLARRGEEAPPDQAPAGRQWLPSFSSFDETLAYFNDRFEYIYRMLSKEVGPIADPILCDAVNAVVERLPAYMRQLQIGAGGRLDEKPILKSVWYLNFEQTIAEFMLGLEEILYAEIYAVKKHLGREYEQLILQWMRENAGK